MIRSSLIISFVLLANIVFGQTKVFNGKAITNTDFSSLKNSISKFDIYEIDASTIYQFLSSKESNSITLKLGLQYTFNLDLHENKIFKLGIKPRVVTENGIELGKMPTIKCYQGFIQNTNLPVALSVDENYLAGLITQDNRSLFIEPLNYMIPGAPVNYYVFYYAEDYHEKKQFKCIALETEDYKNKLKDKIKNEKAKPEFAPLACKEVEIAEASDQLMCAHYGSITAVQNRISTVINNVQTNYCCNFNDNLSLVISDWFNVACGGTDPWTSNTDPEILLNSFSAWGPGNFDEHDIGELFTFREFDGQTIGIAWVGEVCFGLKYNCIQDWTNNSDLLRVTVSHEIGHNFNCDHDDAGSPFIMAPSVSNTNSWSPTSLNSINSFVPTLGCLASCSIGNPPDVDFTSNKVEGCKPITVNFTDLSTNSPIAWSWSFPGGTPSTSTSKNPTIVYSTGGIFNVTLTATNSSGSNTLTKYSYITVKDKPVVNFTYIKNQGEVQFTNTSTEGVNFAWNFGDGVLSSDENPFHEYTEPGNYTVKLTVSNECGTNTKSQNIVIVFIPLANFSSNVTEGCNTLIVEFKDESEFMPTMWAWSFPGGSPSSSFQQNPNVVYNNPGEYDVTLIASNISGSNTITISKYIKIKATPIASYSYSINGYSTNFTNSTNGIGNTYLWNFGDSSSSTEASPVHIYAQSGDYMVSL
ncbi:MAG TPA: PKD domain-containing protein, partial [Saprospiraceae bacterium]|nr:PKD domain-containing protein [Saprospiraceae bacterium]